MGKILTNLIEASPFKTRVATELLILRIYVSAPMFIIACHQYNLGNICDQTTHVEGRAKLYLSITCFIKFCCLHNQLSLLPMSFPPAQITRNLGCEYLESRSQIISVTYSKLNLDPPSNSTDRPCNEKSVPISDEIDAYFPALLIRHDPTIYIESKIS